MMVWLWVEMMGRVVGKLKERWTLGRNPLL